VPRGRATLWVLALMRRGRPRLVSTLAVRQMLVVSEERFNPFGQRKFNKVISAWTNKQPRDSRGTLTSGLSAQWPTTWTQGLLERHANMRRSTCGTGMRRAQRSREITLPQDESATVRRHAELGELFDMQRERNMDKAWERYCGLRSPALCQAMQCKATSGGCVTAAGAEPFSTTATGRPGQGHGSRSGGVRQAVAMPAARRRQQRHLRASAETGNEPRSGAGRPLATPFGDCFDGSASSRRMLLPGKEVTAPGGSTRATGRPA